MGRKAAFTKARIQDLRQKQEQRVQRSVAERNKRHGVDTAERLIQKTAIARPLPAAGDRELLLSQFTEACRLPGPSMDLCTLMHHYAVEDEAAAVAEPSTAGRKRARAEPDVKALDSIADALLRTQNAPAAAGDEDEDEEEEDSTSILQEVLQDDSGRRVVSTLLECLRTAGSKKANAVAEAVLAQFEENEHLPEHHVACRVMSALVEHGGSEVHRRVLDLFRQRGTSIEDVRGLLTNRHTSVTIENLLKQVPKETGGWLNEVLGLTASSPEVSWKKKGKKQQSNNEMQLSNEDLMALLTDAVAGPVLCQLITPATRAAFLSRLDINTLLESKRGTTFLTRLLSLSPAEDNMADGKDKKKQPAATSMDAEGVTAMLEMLLEQLGQELPAMCKNRRANFVVQSIIKLVPVTGKRACENMSKVVRVLGGAELSILSTDNIGVHVLVTLIDTAMGLPNESAVEEIGALLLTRHTVGDLLCSQHGSLVTRHLMPLVARKNSKTGQLLCSAIEQDVATLAYNSIGNLVVQSFLRAIGAAAASAFARKVAKESELLRMCCDMSASHVVFTLLEVVDPTTHTSLCNSLRPHVLTLATHINGRFIVEKVAAASREVREELLRHFVVLSQQKGTQHVLTTLAANLDARGKQNLANTVIVPNLSTLASHQCSTIALQKLMQAEPAVLQAVQAAFAANSRMKNDVAQNFYGKFVVQIALNPQ